MDAAAERLIPDDEFESRLHDGNLGWFVAGEDSSGRVFAQLLEGDRRWTEVLERGHDGIFRSKPELLGKFGALRAEGYVRSGDGMWIHGSSEISWVDVGRMKVPGALTVPPLVSARSEPDGEPLRLDGQKLPDEQRALRFEFALPVYDFPDSRQWRSRLVGFDRSWSEWTSADTRAYTNLPGGDYRLEVQARDGLGRESPIRAGEFSVARAWYLRTPALFLWLIGTSLLLLLVARLGRVGLAARNRQLERAVAERTEEIRRQRDRLEAMAHRDALTGLPNRRDMYRRLADALASTQSPDATMTLMAIDLNEFKQINDRFGHPAGDQVLKRVADTLASHMRTDDVVFRPGGDEFVVLASNLSPDAAMQRAGELVTAVAEAGFDEFAPGLEVSISVGVASVQAPASWEVVLEQADQALYQAKRGGAGPTQVISPDRSE